MMQATLTFVLAILVVWVFLGVVVNIWLYANRDDYYRGHWLRWKSTQQCLFVRVLVFCLLYLQAVILWNRVLRKYL